MTLTLTDGRPAPVEVRIGRDDDGDLTAEPTDGSSLITHLVGAEDDPNADRYQIDTGSGPGDPMTEEQVLALAAACRLILEKVAQPRPVPMPVLPVSLRPVQGPAGLDEDYSAAEAVEWARAESGARLLDTDLALVIALTLLEDSDVSSRDGALYWHTDQGTRAWDVDDHDRVGVLEDAGLVDGLAVTDVGTSALEVLRERETAAA